MWSDAKGLDRRTAFGPGPRREPRRVTRRQPIRKLVTRERRADLRKRRRPVMSRGLRTALPRPAVDGRVLHERELSCEECRLVWLRADERGWRALLERRRSRGQADAERSSGAISRRGQGNAVGQGTWLAGRGAPPARNALGPRGVHVPGTSTPDRRTSMSPIGWQTLPHDVVVVPASRRVSSSSLRSAPGLVWLRAV